MDNFQILIEYSALNNDELAIHRSINSRFRTLAFHEHSHQYEILCFYTGQIQYYLEENSYCLMPGDVLVIPPGTMHRPVVIDENITYSRMIATVDAQYAKELLSRAKNTFVWKTPIPLHIPSGDLASNISKLIEKMLHLPKNDTGFLERDCCATLMLLLIDGYTAGAKREAPPPKTLIQQIIHYVNTHYTEDISLETIAKHFYTNKYHLLRQFKAYTKITVHDYILSKRVILAKALLLSKISPSEVAFSCGFHTYSSFYQTFTQRTGQKPSDLARR